MKKKAKALKSKAVRKGTVKVRIRNGFRLLPHRLGGVPVTLEMVNRLRDEDP
jgi:hypothetical protein